MTSNWKYWFWEHFTWTEWLWERERLLNINIPNDFEWISNYKDIEKKMLRKDWVVMKKYEKMSYLINNLNKFLEKEYTNKIDPIEYLYYLYHIQKLTTIEIFDRLKDFWSYKNNTKNTFEQMFKYTFGWELRWRNEPSANTKRKQSVNNWINTNNPNHINNQRSLLEKNEINFLYEKVKSNVDSLLLEELQKKSTLNQKVIYILHSIGYLENENDSDLADFVKTYQDKEIWFLKTAQIIKWLIIKIRPELESEINDQSLKKRLIERYNKYYK